MDTAWVKTETGYDKVVGGCDLLFVHEVTADNWQFGVRMEGAGLIHLSDSVYTEDEVLGVAENFYEEHPWETLKTLTFPTDLGQPYTGLV